MGAFASVARPALFAWDKWLHFVEQFKSRATDRGASLGSGSLTSARVDGIRSKDLQLLSDMAEFLARLMSVLSSPKV